jgi:hypothetical protein
MKRLYIRTCQECLYKLKSEKEPMNKGTENFDNKKCARCKSPAYDWGSWQDIPENDEDRQILNEEY